MIEEIILVILLGYSPGSANGVKFNTLEYKHASMEVCIKEKEKINKEFLHKFHNKAFCTTRLK